MVCDGARALILENAREAKFPNMKTREVHKREDAKTHEQGANAPGRSINSIDARRSAMEQTDWHDQAEQQFLIDLATRLDAAVMAGEMTSLIMVAPPRALGVLRQAYSDGLRDARARPRSTRIMSRCPCTRSRNTWQHSFLSMILR